MMDPEPIEVLLIEDNDADAKLVELYLEKVDWARIHLERVDRLAEGLARLDQSKFDEVLLDLNLVDSTGLDSFLQIHEKHHSVPVVVLTGMQADHLGLEAVKSGAEDYLPKNRLDPHLLVRTIRYAYERSQRRRTEQRFRDLVETANDWLWEINAEGSFVYSSPRVKQLLGYEPEEVIGRCPFELMPAEEAVRVAAIFWEVARDRRPLVRLENVNLHKDGRRVILESSAVPILDEAGHYLGYRGIDRDITESKLAEAALQAGERRYRRMLSAITNYRYTVHLTNGTPIATEHGPGCQTTTGYKPEDFAADPYLWFRMVHPEDREMVQRHVANVLALRDVPPVEYRIVRSDGGARWVRDTIVQHRNSDGRMSSYDGLIEDITERKEAEIALWERNAHLLAAQKIQERLLPLGPPDLPGFDIAGATFPAEYAAGDYFDYLPMRDGSVGLVVADVSGHGFGPALLTASVRAHLRSLAQTSSDVGEVLTLANAVLYEETEEGHFITLVLARLDPVGRSLAYTSAGHPDGYVFDASGREKSQLPSTGLPLAVLPDSEYPVGTSIMLDPGDLLLLVTDGLHETHSPEGEYFGHERIFQSVREHFNEPARTIVNALHDRVEQHCRPEKPDDDVTVLVVKVTE